MIFFSYVIILTHAKNYEIMHHTHLFLLIYSHARFYNAKKILTTNTNN
jgi:hypothetical protein